jgi:septum formation protein
MRVVAAANAAPATVSSTIRALPDSERQQLGRCGRCSRGGDTFRIKQMDMRGSMMVENAASLIEGLSQRDVVLASETESRRKLLTAAGIAFRIVEPDVDEAAIHEALPKDNGEMDPGDVAELLARAKAQEVSARFPGALVIGADQALSLNGKILDKPEHPEAARDTLFALRGKTHQLHAAVALAEGGQVTWTYIETAHLTMRPFSPQFLGRYLAAAGLKSISRSAPIGSTGSAYSSSIALKATTSRSSDCRSYTCVHAFANTASWPHDRDEAT